MKCDARTIDAPASVATPGLTCVLEPKWTYDPQPDITAHELATLLPFLFAATAHRPGPLPSIDSLGPAARHFKVS